MNLIIYILVNAIETLLRVIPFPCKTGLIVIGNPDRDSPVLMTCNYHLTVARVKRALRGIDCYLLVANSKGHNVWCGSAGGHLTNHSLISVLKTSGIEGHVDHRTIILPQLSATGIEAGVIRKKTGWHAVWGPVYAKDIPAFINNNMEKNADTRNVTFPWTQRLEMAVAWAFPLSLVISLVILPFWKDMTLPITGFIWIFSALMFLLFPLYSRFYAANKRGVAFSRYTILFDFSKSTLVLWAIFMAVLVTVSMAGNTFSWGLIARWGFITLIIGLIMSIDLLGSTPVYKSSLHEDRFLEVRIDEDKCRGIGFCEQVCPRGCYEVNKTLHRAMISRPDRCVRCGACIVQCPFDALYFRSPGGRVISPDTIRTYKLNLLGKRLSVSA
jgi:NAD-dependent dihydropyrimidine dehydrogenase PreA subunit